MAWECKVIKFSVSGLFKPNVNAASLYQMLNHLGTADWELVSAPGIQTGNGATIEIVFILKRAMARNAPVTKGPPPLP